MASLKLMFDEREIAHLSEDGQYLYANKGVPQDNLPLNLFIGNSRKVPLVDVVAWAKKRIFPRNRMDCKEILEMMGLPDYNAWEIVKRTNACLMEDPFWLRFSEDESSEDTTRGRARRIMAEYQKSVDTNSYQLMDIARPTDWSNSPICGPCSFEISHRRLGQELPPALRVLRSSPCTIPATVLYKAAPYVLVAPVKLSFFRLNLFFRF